MATEIRMPRLSQTTDDVKLVSWLVKEGDTVKRGDPLCEVETDKVTMPVESVEGGTVMKILGVPDSIVTAGTPIVILGAPGEIIATAAPEAGVEVSKARPEAPVMESVASPTGGTRPFWKPERRLTAIETPAAGPGIAGLSAGTGGIGAYKGAGGLAAAGSRDVKATSLVRNIARKQGIDLANVAGTGPRGLITKKDLEDFKARGGAGAFPGAPSETAARRVPFAVPAHGAAPATGVKPAPGPVPTFTPAGALKALPLSKNQMLVGRNLAQSMREAPHYYLKAAVLMDRALLWREKNRRQDGSKVSVYSLFVHAASKALQALPRLNGFFKDEKLVLFDEVNIGCAVTAGDDLFVPVIRSADRKGILEIDGELLWLVAKAQNGKLEPHDLLGGTFTLTNLGMYQVDEFCAVINPPQAGILAIARAKKTIHVDDDDRMSIRTACTITGSFDHRIVNGAQGAEFLQKVKAILEEQIV